MACMVSPLAKLGDDPARPVDAQARCGIELLPLCRAGLSSVPWPRARCETGVSQKALPGEPRGYLIYAMWYA